MPASMPYTISSFIADDKGFVRADYAISEKQTSFPDCFAFQYNSTFLTITLQKKSQWRLCLPLALPFHIFYTLFVSSLSSPSGEPGSWTELMVNTFSRLCVSRKRKWIHHFFS